jgi:hypothetical protein
VLKHSFNLSGQELDVDMCNGKFYSLSDEPIIGWKDWKKHNMKVDYNNIGIGVLAIGSCFKHK